MKLSVRVRGDWLAVPVEKGTQTIKWLGNEAMRRYMKNHTDDKIKNGVTNGEEHNVYEVRKTQGGAILDMDDTIRAVLDDNDFVSVILCCDVVSPVLDASEIPYISERIPGKFKAATEFVSLDGDSLSPDDLMRLGKGELKIKLTNDASDRIEKSRILLNNIVAEKKAVYGITTGFGKFAKVVIPMDQIVELQENLIRSHAAGVGPGLPPERTRAFMALRINVLAKGYSGISPKTLGQYIDAFNASCLPWVPEKGTVGASGDLCPLAHLALGVMGEGKMWSHKTGWGEAKYILESNGLEPISLGPKEGLALINGTQLITALAVEACERADNIARQGDVVAALTLEVLKGSTAAFDRAIHEARPHKGQIKVARTLRSLLGSDVFKSEISQSHRFCDRVQDAYTLRCCPQVHGIVHDTIDFVRGILSIEMNSATDNPMVFAERGEIISGGNFHGEYPAKAADYLAIGIHEMASMSERRIERLVNPAYSELPAFLVNNGGLNSGFMIAHCTAASLVSENKVLCHPSSVDSLTTSAGTEDHVSMGGWAARKALRVVEHVEQVVAIELLCACQAIEFLRPLKTTAPLEAVYKLVRTVAAPWDKDRYMAPDIDAVTKLLQEEKIWMAVKPFMDIYHSKHAMEEAVEDSPTSTTYSRMPGAGTKRRRKSLSVSFNNSPKTSNNI